jgi:hypothetical protein
MRGGEVDKIESRGVNPGLPGVMAKKENMRRNNI